MSATDPSGLCWSLAPGVYGPCLPAPKGVPYDGSFTPEEIAQYPQVLEGMNPEDVINLLGGLPAGASVSPAQSASLNAGPGWKLSIKSGGNITIRWSPGSARSDHPGTPYWRVSGGRYDRSGQIPAGTWENGPPEYTEPISPSPDEGGDPCLTAATTLHGVLTGCGGGGIGGFWNGDPFDDPELEAAAMQPACYRTEPSWYLA